jgi:hypothetical protein
MHKNRSWKVKTGVEGSGLAWRECRTLLERLQALEMLPREHDSFDEIDEAAHALDLCASTSDSYWAYARAWLHQEIGGGAASLRGGTSRQSLEQPWGSSSAIFALQGGVGLASTRAGREKR